MRSLAILSALVALAVLAEPGRTQFGCTSPYCQPYPRYTGYGVSSSNYYYGQLPPYLMGGPAYGYTYPQPWYGYNPYPPGPKSYIAPPYAVYQPTVQSHSMYAPYLYYPQAAKAPAAAPKAKGTPLPGKEPQNAAKAPATPEKAAEPPLPQSTKKTSLWKRLIYW